MILIKKQNWSTRKKKWILLTFIVHLLCGSSLYGTNSHLTICSRAPSNVSTIIHILYLPEDAKGENIQFQWKQESLHVGEVYEACWALDNILIINSAHRQVILEDSLDPVDTGNWLFFPGATVKVWALFCFFSFPLKPKASSVRSDKGNYSYQIY